MARRFYHRTSAETARSILVEGFRDGRGFYGFLAREEPLEGVWLSEHPFDYQLADALLEVTLDISDDILAKYQFQEVETGHREWLVPAAMIRAVGDVRLLDEEEEDSLEGELAAKLRLLRGCLAGIRAKHPGPPIELAIRLLDELAADDARIGPR
jgi:hypothetical protein